MRLVWATDQWVSGWFGYEIGLFQGCTASTINFDAAFQPILDIIFSLTSDIGYDFREANIRIPPLVYADDIQFMTSLASHNELYLTSLEVALKWSQTMNSNPSKCRS